MDNFSFRDLRVYQEGKLLVIDCYRVLKRFPQEENYALSAQIRRAATSILLNIAEGSGRVSIKEKYILLK